MSFKKTSQPAADSPAILVIEAAKFERRSLCRLMRAAGAERVAEAVDFDAARHQFAVRRGRHWLVVVDPERQAGAGLEALRDLAAEYCVVAILLLTQRKPAAIEELRAQALQLGLPVISVLRKPVSVEQAGTLLRRLAQPPVRTASPVLSRDELNQCLRTGRMHARFEPKIDLHSGRPVACEALAYVAHPLYGAVSAAGFGQALAQLGAQRMLAASVLRECASLVRELRAKALDTPLAVNLGLEVLCEPGDANALDAYVRTLGIGPADLALEIDATRMSMFSATVADNLRRLEGCGYTLALDGPAALLDLDAATRACFSEVKLSCTAPPGDPRPGFGAHAALEAARDLGLPACALDVRTLADLQQAREAGFETAQGPLFASALPAAEAVLWVEREERNRSFCRPVQRENQAV